MEVSSPTFPLRNGTVTPEADSMTPQVACPLCGLSDAQAEREWIEEERKRLAAYTQGQLDLVRVQREDFLKHRSEVEAALAVRGQELNRQLRLFSAQATRLPARETALAEREAALQVDQQKLAARQQELATAQTALTLREQAIAEREAELSERAARLETERSRLTVARHEQTLLQGDHEAQRLRSDQLRAENSRLEEAIESARQQLAACEHEQVQRSAAPPAREPEAPRPAPAPRSERSSPAPAARTQTAQAAAPAREEERAMPRRKGNPVSVQVVGVGSGGETTPGWIVDRSPDGLCILSDEAAPVDTVLNIRPTKAGAKSRWIQVVVRSCQPERSSWKLGCQFLQKMGWDDLQFFG